MSSNPCARRSRPAQPHFLTAIFSEARPYIFADLQNDPSAGCRFVNDHGKRAGAESLELRGGSGILPALRVTRKCSPQGARIPYRALWNERMVQAFKPPAT